MNRRTQVNFPEHIGVVTDAYGGDVPGDRGKINLITENGNNINLASTLGRLESGT